MVEGLGLGYDDITSKGRNSMILLIFFVKMQEISDISKATRELHRVLFQDVWSQDNHDISRGKRISIRTLRFMILQIAKDFFTQEKCQQKLQNVRQRLNGYEVSINR